MDSQLKILLFASDPTEGKKLNIAGELKGIESAINDSPYRETIQLRIVWNTSPGDLLYEICRYQPRIVQYSGRGTGRGLILHGSKEKSKLLPTEKFIQVLKMVKDDVEFLFMNSCFSSVSSKKIVNEIDQLIGLKGYADDKAAVLFPGFFYRYLFLGYSAARSLELAKTELLLKDINTGYEPLYFSKKQNNDWYIQSETHLKVI